MPEKFVSLEKSLLKEVKSFLLKEGMKCEFTQQGLIELIDLLFTYKEEGKFLFPQLYIIDDLKMFAKVLSPSKFHKIGADNKSSQTFLEAVKKCAPLTEDGWAIYILRLPSTFEYGVFRSGTNILSVPISEIIISKEPPLQPAILVYQTAGKLVEVRGAKGNSIVTNFSTKNQITLSPLQVHEKFIDCIIKNVNEDYKDQARIFFRKLFLKVHQTGHGTLIAVVDYNSEDFPDILKDGIRLDFKIDIIEAIAALGTESPLITNSKIEGYFTLLKGMLSSDGVTILGNDGSIRGYNIFITHKGSTTTKEKFGGSRKRTFNTLIANFDSILIAAYVQSQDGNIQFIENEK